MQDRVKTTAKTSRARRWIGALTLGGALAALVGAQCLLSLTASSTRPAAATDVELHPTGDFTHSKAGFVMPEKIEGFQRVQVTQYDEPGANISAGYNSDPEGGNRWPIVATLYVYPAPAEADLDARFGAILRDIGEQHGGAKPELRKNVLLADGRFAGRYAVFGYEEPWGGQAESVPLRSYVLLYQWKTWWVKWRVTTPAPVDAERMGAIVRLTETLLPPEDVVRHTTERAR
jgi:hypothetical protein